MAYALLALGAVLVIASVGAVCLPVGGLVAGVLCLALGYGLWRSDRPRAAPPQTGSE